MEAKIKPKGEWESAGKASRDFAPASWGDQVAVLLTTLGIFLKPARFTRHNRQPERVPRG